MNIIEKPGFMLFKNMSNLPIVKALTDVDNMIETDRLRCANQSPQTRSIKKRATVLQNIGDEKVNNAKIRDKYNRGEYKMTLYDLTLAIN